ncbi:hypothetical protein FVR03_21375 [Pontibacter qinzhouensis]|uniref:Lipoprotein n=1 Tax=Pontibacter qinzhouensis TaxID=2603253 RepID=A0A5C8IZZ1_9BACT|nr:hypothetical protein [Pontibacter qinzhouensis]TXK26981.1 hypothetical protein FVR03_21375 [Pontibacter qinzhouensis]
MPTLRHLSVLASVLFLFSCNRSADSNLATDTDHAHMVDSAVTDKRADDRDLVYSVPDSITSAAYVPDTTNLSPEPDQPVKILIEGLFHKEEVWQGAEKKQWIGLLYRNGSYEIRPTTLQVKTVYDPVRDAQQANATDKKLISGRQVIGGDTSTLLFITGLAGIKPGAVDTAAYDSAVLKPGQKLPIRFKSKQFMLTAFGDSTRTDSTSSTYAYTSYGWRISGTKNGKKLEQVLAQDDTIDNSVYVLHWAGDLDHDGIPDLVADLSNQYNRMKFALYLSSKAEKGKLYKQVAVFESNRN